MIIEFIGVPGSGKTFHMHSLKNNYSAIRCIDTECYYSFQKGHSHFYLVLRLLFFIIREMGLLCLIRKLNYPKQCIKEDILLLFFMSNYRAFLNTFSDVDNVLVDQGLIQRLWYPYYSNCIVLSKQQVCIINKILQKIYDKKTFGGIYFDVFPETAVKRAKGRMGDCFADRMEYNVLLNMYKIAKCGGDVIVRELDNIIVYKENNNIVDIITNMIG